jgi:hypothetical protein
MFSSLKTEPHNWRMAAQGHGCGSSCAGHKAMGVEDGGTGYEHGGWQHGAMDVEDDRWSHAGGGRRRGRWVVMVWSFSTTWGERAGRDNNEMVVGVWDELFSILVSSTCAFSGIVPRKMASIE